MEELERALPSSSCHVFYLYLSNLVALASTVSKIFNNDDSECPCLISIWNNRFWPQEWCYLGKVRGMFWLLSRSPSQASDHHRWVFSEVAGPRVCEAGKLFVKLRIRACDQ